MGTSCWVSNKHAAVLATCSAQLVQFSPQPPRSQLTNPTQPSTLALATRPAHRPTAAPAAIAPLSMPAATLLPSADDSLPSAPSTRFMGA